MDNWGCLPQDLALLGLLVGIQGDVSIGHRFLACVLRSRAVQVEDLCLRSSFRIPGRRAAPKAPTVGGTPTVPVSPPGCQPGQRFLAQEAPGGCRCCARSLEGRMRAPEDFQAELSGVKGRVFGTPGTHFAFFGNKIIAF